MQTLDIFLTRLRTHSVKFSADHLFRKEAPMRRHNIRIPLILVTVLVALWLSPVPGRSGQADLKTFRGEVTDSICAKTGSHDVMMAKMPSMGRDKETCTKQCTEIGAKYVLYDDASKAVHLG